MFKEQNPAVIPNIGEEELKLRFRRISLKAGLGLLRPLKLPQGIVLYNVKRIELTPAQTPITLSLLNCQGLITINGKNKSEFLHGLISATPTEHIVAITETHLLKEYEDAEIIRGFSNYTLHRCDRDVNKGRKKKWGGTLLLTSRNILSTEGDHLSNGCCEILITELNELKITMITVYRPPDTTTAEFKEILEFARNYLTTHTCQDIILVGDFNFPKEIVVWKETEDGVVPLPTTYISDERKEQFQELLDFSNEHFLHQIISMPTRLDNTLDLVFTNVPAMLHSPISIPIESSDHCLIQAQSNYGSKHAAKPTEDQDQPEMAKYSFERADKDTLKVILQLADLKNIVANAPSVQKANEALTNKFVECAKKAKVPVKTNSPANQVPNNLRPLFKKRIQTMRKLKSKHQSETYNVWKQNLNEINSEIIRIQEANNYEKERKQINNLKTDPAAFYKYAKESKDIRSTIGPLIDTANGNTNYESGPKKMADILSNQYESVFTKPQHGPRRFDNLAESSLTDINFTTQDITQAIKEISVTSAPGPDGIPPIFLKDYAEEIAEALQLLWRKSLDTGESPEGTHLAYITPIFKSGAKSEPANYRPVSLTNHITKVFERIVKKEITFYLTGQQLYNETQHGFRKRRSTQTNLIEYYESILHQLETNRSTDSIYLDFSKAFDKCDHGIILDKLSALGITGKLNQWIETFLRNRKQIVVVNGSKSEPVWVTSGVPQGSVLGPLLFLILMYDITDGITNALLSSFADDTKVWRGINSAACSNLLQNELNIIYNWAIQNNMQFNDKKFQAIHFYHMVLELIQPPYRYTDSTSKDINFTKNVKDLGIQMSEDLSFATHISTVAAKGKQMAGWILRIFKSRDIFLLKTLLKQLILPRIEYCCVLWSPTLQSQISQLESVQRFFTKKINFGENKDLDYWQRLQALKIYSAERRRERYIIIYTWKVIHGLYPNPGLELNNVFPALHNTNPMQGIDIKTINERTGIKISHNTPSTLPKKLKDLSILEKCCTLFNCLPAVLRKPICNTDDPEPGKFKSALDNWLVNIPDQPTIPSRFRPAQTNSILHQMNYMP